jgi:lipopolysaccharide/colanic/teichoic acid biosynthesis glycosyltransferase
MKRTFDFLTALIALALLAPLLAGIALAIWLDDRRSPFFLARRVARGGGDFRMLKFRTMIPDAWKSGVNSTATGDARITFLGRRLRQYKLDELPQLWNVLLGDMALVGPRPQVRADASLYTTEELRILEARPGITDPASIVFADEGEILAGSANPDLVYNQIVRPWKSRLSLLYLANQSFPGDLYLLWLTALALSSRPRALRSLNLMLDSWGADDKLKEIARRTVPLDAWPPPGAEKIVAQYAPAVESVLASRA